MRAVCLTVANPFDPLGSRRLRHVRRRARIRALAPRGNRPVIAILNGRPVLRAEWRRKLRDGDMLSFVVLPRGGGGGGRSNPLKIILSLVLLIFAPHIAGFALKALGLSATTTLIGGFTLGQATTLGVMLAGNALINALFPVRPPAALPAPSPTYSIQAQGNLARIEEPVPVQYGRLLVYPDYAAQPYTEFHGQEQYLYALLCLGEGEFDVEEIRIEDTPISSFEEVTTEVVEPGDRPTLFPTDVTTSVEVSGQSMRGKATGTWSQSGTTITVTETGHGRATGQGVRLEFTSGIATDGAFTIATVPDADTFTVTAATGSSSGNVDIFTIVGGEDGFVVNAAGTTAHRVDFDVVMPVGLYEQSGGGLANKSLSWVVQVQEIDDDGAAVGSWTTLDTVTVTDRSTTPLRFTYDYGLEPAGRYRARVWRTDVKSTSASHGHELQWSGLRCHLNADAEYGGATLIAVRMRATNNLSLQASRRVAVLCTRKVPVWNGTSWSSPVATSSIAWALADAARNADYGAGLADSRLDLDALLDLDAEWGMRNDEFNGRFDQALSWWDAVTRIATAGRARVFMQGGVLRVVRDSAATVPVAMFSMRNIKRGTFSVDYLPPTTETADRVDVAYFDGTTWSPRRVTAALPESAAAKPAKLDLFGVTSRAQAIREGLYVAASNRYRRRLVRFSTEMEGFIPSIGDLISVQHDAPSWGMSAEAVAWDAGTLTVTVSEPMAFASGAHYVAFRADDGSVSGPWLVTAGATDRELVLADTPDMMPVTSGDRERTHVVFGKGQSWSALAKVMATRPRGLYDVEIEAVIEDARVHTAEAAAAAPGLASDLLPRIPVQPVVGGLLARLVPGDSSRVMLSWQPAAGAERYLVEMAEGDDVTDTDVTWTRVADTTTTHHALTMLYSDRTMVRVRGLGLAAGPWSAAAVGDLLGYMWTGSDSDLMWTGSDSDLMWS